MSWSIWFVVGIIFILVWCWLGWEAWNSPIYPDNYNEQGINPDHEKVNGSNDEEQQFKGFYNGKTDTYIEDNNNNDYPNDNPYLKRK